MRLARKTKHDEVFCMVRVGLCIGPASPSLPPTLWGRNARGSRAVVCGEGHAHMFLCSLLTFVWLWLLRCYARLISSRVCCKRSAKLVFWVWGVTCFNYKTNIHVHSLAFVCVLILSRKVWNCTGIIYMCVLRITCSMYVRRTHTFSDNLTGEGGNKTKYLVKSHYVYDAS